MSSRIVGVTCEVEMRPRVIALFAPLVLAALGAFGAEARADSLTATPDANNPAMRAVSPERRNGLVLGAAGGVGFAGASGYPNNAKLLGNPDYYSQSPLLVGWHASFFLMGALTDYVSFGPMMTVATFESASWKSVGYALGFRAEAYPLLKLVPMLADTSVYGQLGFGTTELRAKGPYPSADGSQAFFGIGLHHEFRLVKMLGGHSAIGPFIEYDAIRSESAERHWLSIGVRLAWYGGTVGLDRTP
jgi:hypothetical protein